MIQEGCARARRRSVRACGSAARRARQSVRPGRQHDIRSNRRRSPPWIRDLEHAGVARLVHAGARYHDWDPVGFEVDGRMDAWGGDGVVLLQDGRIPLEGVEFKGGVCCGDSQRGGCLGIAGMEGGDHEARSAPEANGDKETESKTARRHVGSRLGDDSMRSS
jgi:hypothetical protein